MAALECEIVAPRTYQDYSRERKAEVLALVKANGGNVMETSRETGIRSTTIQYWIDTAERNDEFREHKQAELADRFEGVAHAWLGIAEAKAEQAPFNHLMIGVGIAVDKMRLLRGDPTEIAGLSDSNIERLSQTLVADILEAATQRRAQLAQAESGENPSK